MSKRRRLEKAVRCLNSALHPATSDTEALAAIEGFRRLVSSETGSWMPVESLAIELYADRYDGRDLSEYQQVWAAKHAAQEEEIVKLRAQIDRLQQRNEQLKGRNDRLREQRDRAVEKLAIVQHAPEWVSGAKPEMVDKTSRKRTGRKQFRAAEYVAKYGIVARRALMAVGGCFYNDLEAGPFPAALLDTRGYVVFESKGAFEALIAEGLILRSTRGDPARLSMKACINIPGGISSLPNYVLFSEHRPVDIPAVNSEVSSPSSPA
jgi:cell division protein FtsB